MFVDNYLQVLEVLEGTQTQLKQEAHCALLSVDTVALKMRLVKKTATSPPLGRQPQ